MNSAPMLKAPRAMACIAGVGMLSTSAFLAAREEERSPDAPFRAVRTPVSPKIIEEKRGILDIEGEVSKRK